MSSIYNLEPQPTASVILNTTIGDLSIELFAKQTPLTCRNFLQLCLDGYYDNTIFHRLVPGFIIQGGDPTGTGNGGECIYDGGALSGDLDPWPMDQRRGKNAGPTGVNFKDEFHSRLKFNRRGLLGMANEGKPDTNGSQFFFTLDKTEELNNKNTVFGRVVGDTIYNLARMGEAEVAEGSERPLYPIKITGAEILANPFDDMKKRIRTAQPTTSGVAAEKKKKKPKNGKKLLSFDDEEGDTDAPVIKKAKFDSRIVMDVDAKDEVTVKKPATAKQKEEKPLRKTMPVRETQPDTPKVEKAPSPPSEKRPIPARPETSPEREVIPKKSALEQANEEIAALKASMKRTIHSEPVQETKKSALEQMIPTTSSRGRKRRRGGENASTDDDLSMFQAFKAKLKQAGPEKEQPTVSLGDAEEKADVPMEGEAALCDLHFIANCQSCTSWDKVEKEDSDDEGWMSHSLSFAADKLGKDLSYRKKAEEELVVIDPREKARTLKEERRAQRDAQSGRSGREWDQARLAKLARSSALAGRGAR
ncbi:cyclophilin type peptidyl-prolyl cis-trans isomerase/CLD [Xylaria bambusicola]|uniref:cyclophilin type peptidyl-prolyl cis-trans isomerase/CLD n=1 Tax=Xylaria bambusicola TaxID=326684 RepID=UPI00200726B5|nr:cyclophilin type peptidyl-prolyl cis-trans isomerase/CLD [Xylaria bambusicola]KAI0503150.1 cyclophilin type peptidyl-prolyl cis-trans isomerase/CLD [Xylaria bambusicola]